ADVVAAAVEFGAPHLVAATTLNALWARAATDAAVFAVEVIWWVGAMACVLVSLEPQPRLRLLGRICALWLALFAVNAAVPHAPAFVGRDFDIRDANWWEYAAARYGERGEIARIDAAQPKLLQAELDALKPQRRGGPDVYAIGIAGV